MSLLTDAHRPPVLSLDTCWDICLVFLCIISLLLPCLEIIKSAYFEWDNPQIGVAAAQEKIHSPANLFWMLKYFSWRCCPSGFSQCECVHKCSSCCLGVGKRACVNVCMTAWIGLACSKKALWLLSVHWQSQLKCCSYSGHVVNVGDFWWNICF